MHEVLAFSAILTAVAFLVSSFAVFWPEYRAAQKRDAAGTDGTARAGKGQSGNRHGYRHAGPEDMKRYLFDSSACPAPEKGEEKEGVGLAAKD